MASATTDFPAIFDGRSMGMGGTGVAFAENATGALYNPALLDGVKTLDLTATFSPTRPQLSAPFMGEQRSSDAILTPMFFVGGAFRLHERIAAGVAFYPIAGAGAQYTGLPGGLEVSQSIGLMELNVPVAVRLADGLSLGAGYRVTYLMQKVKAPDVATGAATEINLSGFNFAGFDAGLYYRPLPILGLGLTYRSKINVTSKGDFKVAGTKQADVDSSFGVPQSIRFGAAVHLLPDTLLLAADFRFAAFKQSNPSLDMTIKTPLGSTLESQPLGWKNTVDAHFGLEYAAMPMLKLRAGYTLGTTATPEELASPFLTPPGTAHAIHLGAGLSFGSWNLDAGGYYCFGSRTINDQPAVTPGDYKLNILAFALSANYHM